MLPSRQSWSRKRHRSTISMVSVCSLGSTPLTGVLIFIGGEISSYIVPLFSLLANPGWYLLATNIDLYLTSGRYWFKYSKCPV